VISSELGVSIVGHLIEEIISSGINQKEYQNKRTIDKNKS